MDLLFWDIERKIVNKNQSLSLLSFVMSLPALVSICWAGNLALNDNSGWGWFLGLGLLLTLSPLGIISKEQQANNKIKNKINEG